MSTIPNPPLPTLLHLNATLPQSVDAPSIAQSWLNAFSTLPSSDLPKLFVPDAFWRDMLALTWDFRTFFGLPLITQFVRDRIPITKPTAFTLRSADLQQPFPDIAWVSLVFGFETTTGIASGIARLVPTADSEWRAHCVYTNLEDLKGFPEKIGPLRNSAPNHGRWEEDRRREKAFENTTPTVLIIGGGQSGLGLAARLKALDIKTLVVEKNSRIGDNWRNRYEALCLHDPVWYDHMPYLPFPPTWPVYTPALKLANWLESYAETFELNVWTNSTVTKATQDAEISKWNVTIEKDGPNGTTRTFTVSHLIFATGLGGEVPETPSYPGMDKFKGKMLHSSQHKKALDHAGKKVVVVGACTSAHDICVDYYDHGVDVTMYQRSSTYVMSTENGWKVLMEGVYSENAVPTDLADRLNASFPHHLNIGVAQRKTKIIAELDKDILDGLRNRGFKLNDGIIGSGLTLLARIKAGGYYLDTGGSQLIADGKIKLKSGSQISRFSEHTIVFEDGSELEADIVIFATGVGDTHAHIRDVCGLAVAKKCKPLWGFDKEGEVNGAWRDLGFKGLWYMMGNLALCRFHSKHVALQIKAIEEGVFGERYSADE